MLDISLQPIDWGINVPRLTNVSVHSLENEHLKLQCLEKVASLWCGCFQTPIIQQLTGFLKPL